MLLELLALTDTALVEETLLSRSWDFSLSNCKAAAFAKSLN